MNGPHMLKKIPPFPLIEKFGHYSNSERGLPEGVLKIRNRVSILIILVFCWPSIMPGQSVETDTLRYFDELNLTNQSLWHLDWCLDWGIYFNIENPISDISLKQMHLLFPEELEYFMNESEIGPDSISVFFKEAINDSAPGLNIYDSLKIFFTDSNNTVFPDWTIIDLQNHERLKHLPHHFWVTCHQFWWTCFDTLNVSGHTRTNIDDGYWQDTFDFAIQLIYEYESNGIKQEISIRPNTPSISSIYPNPFNGSTTISYYLPSLGQSSLDIYDLAGRAIISFPEIEQTPGIHTLQWNGKSSHGTPVPTGIYFISLKYTNNIGRHSLSKKLLILK